MGREIIHTIMIELCISVLIAVLAVLNPLQAGQDVNQAQLIELDNALMRLHESVQAEIAPVDNPSESVNRRSSPSNENNATIKEDKGEDEPGTPPAKKHKPRNTPGTLPAAQS